MRNRAGIFLGTMSILVLAAIIVMAFLMTHRPEKVAPINKLLTKAPRLHPVIVLDFDNSGAVGQVELLRGKDAIITVMHPAKRGGVTDELFNSVEALRKLDVNKDNIIDKRDPLYSHLQLMFLTSDGKSSRYVSFEQAGIKSIKLQQQWLNEKAIAGLNPENNKVGEAIMINGAKHDLRLVAVVVP